MQDLTLPRASARGNALAETIVVVLAMVPLLGGVVFLGKQLDLKHKSFDALRYSVWERTVWGDSGATAKSQAELETEVFDRAFGDPRAGVLSIRSLQTDGVSQNRFWRYNRGALLDGATGDAVTARTAEGESPVDVGYILAPGLAHGTGPVGVAASALQLDDLGLNRGGLAHTTVAAKLRPLLGSGDREQTPLSQRASGAILSDSWSPRNEHEFRSRVDGIVANELIDTLELPGRPLSMQATGKGGPLYGEGQYSWDLALGPRSDALPAAFIVEREER